MGAAALTALASSAQAQQVRFAGSTLGCFYTSGSGPAAPGGAPCALAAFSTLGGDITFTAGAYDIFTDPAGVSGVSYGAIGNVSASNSLGVVASTGTPFSATGDQYLRLRMSFTDPVHTTDVPANGNPSLNVFDVDYLISGSSQAPGVGGINFVPVGGLITPGFLGVAGLVFDPINNVIRSGNFYTGDFVNGDVFPVGPAGGTAAGTVNYHTLDTRSLTSGGNSTLTSFLQIQSTVTPEPATLALMGTGLLGIVGAGFVRRRSV